MYWAPSHYPYVTTFYLLRWIHTQITQQLNDVSNSLNNFFTPFLRQMNISFLMLCGLCGLGDQPARLIFVFHMQHRSQALFNTSQEALRSLYMPDDVLICPFTSHNTEIRASSQVLCSFWTKANAWNICKVLWCWTFVCCSHWQKLKQCLQLWHMSNTNTHFMPRSSYSSCGHNFTLIELTCADMVELGYVYIGCIHQHWTPGLILLDYGACPFSSKCVLTWQTNAEYLSLFFVTRRQKFCM